MEDATRAAQARKRRRNARIATIVMTLVGAGSLILAAYNATGHRWTGMTGNLFTAASMAFGLIAQRLLNKQRAGQSRSL